MLQRLRPRFTFANVVACLALFVALGSGAYAATQLPKNSVGSKQIKKNAVNSVKVKDRSLKAVDFKEGQLPAGATGPQGPKGDTGAPGATKVIARRDVEPVVANLAIATESSFCEEGETLVGGGGAFVNGSNQYETSATMGGSVPIGAGGKPVVDLAEATGWRASGKNESGGNREFIVVALCATP